MTRALKPKKHDKHGREVPQNAALDLPARRFWDQIDHQKLELFMLEPKHCDQSTGVSKYNDFLRSFHDPNQMRLTFPARLRRYNISLHEAQTIYMDGNQQLGLLAMSEGTPQIMADVTDDAKSQMVLCARCDGLKTLTIVGARDEKGKPTATHERDCPVCNKVGKVRVPGDKHARDLVFESMKLTKQGTGPLVAIQQNFGASGLDSNVESLLKLTQSITVGERKDN